MRYILDSYKDELRDLGGDPDAVLEVPPLPVKSKSLALQKKNQRKEAEDPQ